MSTLAGFAIGILGAIPPAPPMTDHADLANVMTERQDVS